MLAGGTGADCSWLEKGPEAQVVSWLEAATTPTQADNDNPTDDTCRAAAVTAAVEVEALLHQQGAAMAGQQQPGG